MKGGEGQAMSHWNNERKWKLDLHQLVSSLSFHNNQVILILYHFSLSLGNFILCLENFGVRVDDTGDSEPSEKPDDHI